jgi:hypothetical protein
VKEMVFAVASAVGYLVPKWAPSLHRFKARSGNSGMEIGPFLCIKILMLKLNEVVASC